MSTICHLTLTLAASSLRFKEVKIITNYSKPKNVYWKCTLLPTHIEHYLAINKPEIKYPIFEWKQLSLN